MKSPYWIPYGRQSITEEDESFVLSCLKGEFLTQGPAVEAFERKLCLISGCQESIAFNSATSALHASCLALGLGKNDWLWTSPISFVASANCALYCGAKVDFVDIEPETGLIDLNILEKKLILAEKLNKLPKIIIPVHLAGSSCDLKKLSQLRNQYGFKIIEDASHAIGAFYENKPIGSCCYSDITVFSFHPVKIITTCEGGAALSNNSSLCKRLRSLRSHGIVRENFIYSKPGDWYYEQQELGYNYRLNDLQASLGISQLNRLNSFITKRRYLIKRYVQLLSSMPIRLLTERYKSKSSYHLSIVTLDNITPDQHTNIFKKMRLKNIGVQLHYWPIHLQPYYQNIGFSIGQLPNAEKYANTSFSIPLYYDLTEEAQDIVVTALRETLIEEGIL